MINGQAHPQTSRRSCIGNVLVPFRDISEGMGALRAMGPGSARRGRPVRAGYAAATAAAGNRCTAATAADARADTQARV